MVDLATEVRVAVLGAGAGNEHNGRLRFALARHGQFTGQGHAGRAAGEGHRFAFVGKVGRVLLALTDRDRPLVDGVAVGAVAVKIEFKINLRLVENAAEFLSIKDAGVAQAELLVGKFHPLPVKTNGAERQAPLTLRGALQRSGKRSVLVADPHVKRQLGAHRVEDGVPVAGDVLGEAAGAGEEG